MFQHPWESSYPEGFSWAPHLSPPSRVEELLVSAAEQWPDDTAVEFFGKTITFSMLHELATKAAKGFQELGVGPGVHVGLSLLNSPHYPICFFGALMAGGVVVNFNPNATRRDTSAQIADAEVKVLVTLASSHSPAITTDELVRLATIVVCDPADFRPRSTDSSQSPQTHRIAVSFLELLSNDGAYSHHPHRASEDDIAALQYTGGTTGISKGAMLSHANFAVVVSVFRYWLRNLLEARNNKILVVLPLFHIFGVLLMLLSVATGTQMIFHLHFDSKRVLTDIERKRITMLFGVPTMYAALVCSLARQKFDLSSLKLCGSGGAPLRTEIARQFEYYTGIVPRQGYSLTETTNLGTWEPPVGAPHMGTVGLPLPHTLVEIVDLETGSVTLPRGQHGEICFVGPQVMKGYWKNADETAQVLKGGRLHTGDIGFIDEHGYVTLVDRKKDVILCGGQNIFPRKIELAICEHPSVAEAAVIGIPDRFLGEVAKAFVVLEPNTPPLTYEELRLFLAERLASSETPAELEVRSHLPKTSVGKISKKDLSPHVP